MRYLVMILLATYTNLSLAKSDSEKLSEFTLKYCNYKLVPNEDDRIDCVTDIVNCAIVGSGEIDLTNLDYSCLNKVSKRRKHEQLQD